MSIPNFNYLAPKNLQEALQMHSEHAKKSCIMAGGTDLLIKMGLRHLMPEYVIGLNSIPGIDYIAEKDGRLAIGAMAKLSDIEENDEIKRNFPALAEAARVTATVQIRNMGTLVGNICNASPSADNATPLMVYDAMALIMSSKGERTVAMDEFFTGPGKSVLQHGELVKEILIPKPDKISGSSYQKISTRSKVDIAGVCVSASISLDKNGNISKARIALGAVSPKPIRVYEAEKMLSGQKPGRDLFKEVAKIAKQAASPISDMRASAPYRTAMVEVLTERALQDSFESAEQKRK